MPDQDHIAAVLGALDSSLGTGVAALIATTAWFVLVFLVCACITAWLANWVKREAHHRRIEEHVFLAELSNGDTE